MLFIIFFVAGVGIAVLLASSHLTSDDQVGRFPLAAAGAVSGAALLVIINAFIRAAA